MKYNFDEIIERCGTNSVKWLCDRKEGCIFATHKVLFA